MHIDWNRLQGVLVCLALAFALAIGLGWALLHISHAIVLFALAIVLALILLPLVEWGERHHLARWLAVVVTYAVFVLFVLAMALVLIGPVAAQVLDLASALPDYIARVQETVMRLLEGNLYAPAAIDFIHNRVVASLAAWITDFVGALVGVFGSIGGLVTDSVLTLIISIYMVLGGRQIHAAVHGVLPAPYGGRFLFVTSALGRVLGGYIRSQLVLALVLGIVVSIGLFLLGMPYALLLGVLAMVLGLIPMFGSALSAVPALFLALTQPWPMVLWVLLFFIIVQNLQDQVLAPRLQGESLGLHPLAVLFALLAGAQLAGWFGALFALPIAGFIWILTVALYRTFIPSARTSTTGNTGQIDDAA